MNDALLAEFRFDAEQLPESQRFAVWRDALSANYDVSLLPGGDANRFTASVVRWALGSIVVTDGKVTAHRMTRSAQQAETDGVDRYGLMLLRSGRWTGDFDGTAVSIGKGSPFLIDFSRPFDCASTNSGFLMVHMSRDVLDDALPPDFDGHGVMLTGASGVLLTEHLHALVRHLPKLTLAEGRHVGNATCDLIAACLVASREAAETARPQIERALLHQAKRYVNRNLHSRDLTHDQICQALGISRSNLYRVFKPLGGVSVHIQQRRLARIHQLLANPKEYRSITEIASQYGFISVAHFSRAFRQAFGSSPSEARLLASKHDMTPKTDIGQEYRDWVTRYES